jgi:uncharacterized protein (TIGR04255 family)
LRFKTSLPASVVYGVIYTALKDDFSNAKSLEIMNLPEEVRLKSPQFKNKAWYQLQSEELILQIGPDVLVFNCDSSKDYIGWRSYFKLIHDTLEKIFNTGVIENVTRTGIRYVSFFEEVNIFEKIKLNIQYDSKGLSGENTLFTTDLKGESFTRRLTVQNNSLLQKDNIQKLGSVVDIDAFNTDSIDELSNIESVLNASISTTDPSFCILSFCKSELFCTVKRRVKLSPFKSVVNKVFSPLNPLESY